MERKGTFEIRENVNSQTRRGGEEGHWSSGQVTGRVGPEKGMEWGLFLQETVRGLLQYPTVILKELGFKKGGDDESKYTPLEAPGQKRERNLASIQWGSKLEGEKEGGRMTSPLLSTDVGGCQGPGILL